MLMISDSVWNEIKTIIPDKKTNIGRPLTDRKKVLSGILYIKVTGAQWRNLPDYYGKKSTVHGHLRNWIKKDIFNKIFNLSIDLAVKKLGDPACFFNDTSFSKAPFARFGGKNPTDRRKNGVKRGILIDMNRVILSILIEAANRHDSTLLIPHIKNIKKFLNRPKVMVTDSAWDVVRLRKDMAQENIALHASTNVRRNKSKRKIKSGGTMANRTNFWNTTVE